MERSPAHFVRHFADRQGKVIDHIPDSAIETLLGHTWPGNIRELQNIIERAVIATRSNALDVPAFETPSNRSSSGRTLAQVEREHILATLTETNWVIGGWKGAAARLGLSRTTLIARMQRLGLSRKATQNRPRAARIGGGSARQSEAVRAAETAPGYASASGIPA